MGYLARPGQLGDVSMKLRSGVMHVAHDQVRRDAAVVAPHDLLQEH